MVRKMILMVSVVLFLAVAANGAQFPLDYFGAYDAQTRDLMRQVEVFHLNSNHMDKSVYELIRAGNYSQTFNELRYVLDRIPNHPRALQIAGSVSRLAKQLSFAVGYFEKATTLYPQYAVTHAQYGQFLMDIGQLDEGIQKLVRATEADPKFAAAHALLANAYVKKGNTDLAREAAQKAREFGFQGQLPPGL